MRFAVSSDRKNVSASRGLMLRVAAALAIGLTLSACDTLDKLNPFGDDTYKPEIKPQVPPDKLYNQGLGRLANGSYSTAAKRFEEIDKQYPYSPYAKKALIMSAYTNYQKGDYEESISSAKRFLALHPADKDASYAQYLLAMSYYNQIPDITRDQSTAVKAVTAFKELIERYPKSEYLDDARFKLEVCRDQLAGKEMEIGRYYLKRRNYTAAINRFRDVIANYQTTRHVEEALERLTEAYMALGITSEAQTAAAVLGHNFPSSQWYKDAYALLKTNGKEPREDKQSWISKAFKDFTGIVGLNG